jgi:hypothetical protein
MNAGYDLNCVCPVPGQLHHFASGQSRLLLCFFINLKYARLVVMLKGADEKVVRVFEAPLHFLVSLASISGKTQLRAAGH